MNRTKRFTLAALCGGLLAGIGSKAFAHGGRHGFGAGPLDPAEMNERVERFVKHLAVEVDQDQVVLLDLFDTHGVRLHPEAVPAGQTGADVAPDRIALAVGRQNVAGQHEVAL